ncbi:MAG: acyltransferase [Ruminococcus sp.]|nr:acyltransferase [Ruminococcus sp.]
MSDKKTRNCSIDVFRYLCAILVVAIHTSPFYDINENLGYIFNSVITRIAVPFFFAVAGYYYIGKLADGKKVFGQYVLRLVRLYGIWTAIYYLKDVFFLLLDMVSGESVSIGAFVREKVVGFLITGSADHFWYFPALIISVMLVTLIHKFGGIRLLIPLSIVVYIIGLFGTSYYSVGVQIPLLGDLYSWENFNVLRRILFMGFPFFVSGYFVRKLEPVISSAGASYGLLAAGLVMFVGEITLINIFELSTNIIITAGLYVLLCAVLLTLLRHPMPKLSGCAALMRVEANFTYYSHPLVLVGFDLIDKFVGVSVTGTLLFVLTAAITFLLGFIISKCNNKFIRSLVS